MYLNFGQNPTVCYFCSFISGPILTYFYHHRKKETCFCENHANHLSSTASLYVQMFLLSKPISEFFAFYTIFESDMEGYKIPRKCMLLSYFFKSSLSKRRSITYLFCASQSLQLKMLTDSSGFALCFDFKIRLNNWL